MRTLYLLFTLGISSGLTSQSLTLVSGTKKKVIEPGQWLEITAGLPSDMYEDDCLCPSWIGQFLGMEGDQIQLRAHYKFERVDIQDSLSPVRRVGYEGAGHLIPVESIPTASITTMTVKGKGKHYRDLSGGQTIGAILMVFGTGALAATPIVEERGELALLGFSEILLGIAMGAGTRHRRFVLSEELHLESGKPLWRFKN